MSDFEHLRLPESPLAGLEGESIKFPMPQTDKPEAVPLRKAAGAESMSMDAVGSILSLRGEASDTPSPTPEASVGGISGGGGGYWSFRPVDRTSVTRPEAPRRAGGTDFGSLLRADALRAADRAEDLVAARALALVRSASDAEVVDMVRAQAAAEAAEFERRRTVPPGMIPAWMPVIPLPDTTPRPIESRVGSVSAGTNSGDERGKDEERRQRRHQEAADRLANDGTSAQSEAKFSLPQRLHSFDPAATAIAESRAAQAAARVLLDLRTESRQLDKVAPGALAARWRSHFDAI